MRTIITVIFLFILFAPYELNAQKDLTLEWEMQYLKRQQPDKIKAAIGVRQGMVIGEVGAGRGRFTGLKPGANLVIIDPPDSLIDGEFGIDRSKLGEQPPTIKELNYL